MNMNQHFNRDDFYSPVGLPELRDTPYFSCSTLASAKKVVEGMEQQRSESDYVVPTSKITVFIEKITKMSKNPNIDGDLSQVLDDFLEKLGECDRYLENGIFNMNFAEAALLLQSSADLYSKRVDVLWDIIFDYQKRLLLSEEQNGDKNEEIEKVEERKRKYKRKRKANSDESQSAKLVNSFSFGNLEYVDYLNQNYETVDLSKEWSKFQPKKTVEDTLHIPNKNFIFLPNNAVHSEDNDYIGRYDQFHSMSLIDEIFHLQEKKLLTDEYNCVTKMRIDCYVVNDFLLDKSIPSTKPIDSYASDLKEYIRNFFETHKHPEKGVTASELELCRKSYVSLQKLPFTVVRDKLRRCSLADSLLDDDHIGSLSEHCPSPCHSIEHDMPKDCGTNESFEQITKNLETRSKSCSQDSAFYEDEDHGEENCEVDADIIHSTAESAILADNLNTSSVAQNAEAVDDVSSVVCAGVAPSLTEETMDAATIPHTDTEDDTLVSERTLAAKEVVKCTKVRTSPISDKKLSLTSTVITRPKVMKRWASLLEGQEEEESVENKRRKVTLKRRISKKVLKKLASGITVKYRDFELFCRMQYKAAEGEGIVPAQLSDSDDSDQEDNMSEEEDDDPTPINTDNEMSDLDDKDREEEEVEAENDVENPINKSNENPTSIPPDLPDLLMSPILGAHQRTPNLSEDRVLGLTSTPHRPTSNLSDLDADQDESLRKNIREWRSFIIPKLKSLQNRADFDIHEYGSRIIEPSQIGEQRHFKDVVQGKTSAEVARYFIATLQLANTYNVEITGAVPGKTANDTFQIKTLDKTKYHELLEEYQAPSEETFRERLQRVKAGTSREHCGPPVKRIKFTGRSERNF